VDVEERVCRGESQLVGNHRQEVVLT
jgi:hypothetical protein